MTKATMRRRVVDRILADDYVADIQQMDGVELVKRRQSAIQEESNVSYVRRNIQGRLDILKAEQHRRVHGGPAAEAPESADSDEDLVRRLAAVLTDRPASGQRPTALRTAPSGVTVDPQIEVYSRRSAEFTVSDVRLSDPRSLTDAELDEAISKLTELEQDVSKLRVRVQTVVDCLQGEIQRRIEVGTIEAHEAD